MQKYNRCVSIAKKAVRYAPPLFAQIAMFVASRVLADEYSDYAVEDTARPLAAKATLVALTLSSALSGLAAYVFGWGIEEPTKFVRRGDLIIQIVTFAVTIYLACGMIIGHYTMLDAGLACKGPNLRVCLPEASECQDTKTPPCDAHIDKDLLTSEGVNPTLNTSVLFTNDLGWALNIYGNLEYRTCQVETYGNDLTLATTVATDNLAQDYLTLRKATSTLANPFTAEPDEKTELALLKEPSIRTSVAGDMDSIRSTHGFDTSRCEEKQVDAFDGSKVKVNPCGANAPIPFSDAAIQAGKLCRYGCGGSNDQCLERGAPSQTVAGIYNAFKKPMTDYVAQMYAEEMGGLASATGSMQGPASDSLQEAAADFMDHLAATLIIPVEDVNGGKRQVSLKYAFRDAHYDFAPTTTIDATEVAAPYRETGKLQCLLEPALVADHGICSDHLASYGSVCCLKKVEGVDAMGVSMFTAMGGGVIQPMMMVPHPLAPERHINIPPMSMPCGIIDGVDNLDGGCPLCTDPDIIPCGSDGEARGDPAGDSLSTPILVNATVGFSTDNDDLRFGGKDWRELERTWCGSKLSQDTYEGFYGLTTATLTLMVISVLTTLWDSITMINEPSRAKAFAIAAGIILTEILNVLLFLWPAFKTAMLVFVGHKSGAAAAGISSARASEIMLSMELEWAAPVYRLIAFSIAIIQGLKCLLDLVMALWAKNRNVRAVGIAKMAFVGVSLGVLWRSNLDILGAIAATEEAIPKAKRVTESISTIIDGKMKFPQDLDRMKELITGSQMLAPQTDIGQEDSGWEVMLVYFLTLAIGLIDQIELLVLQKLEKLGKQKSASALGLPPTLQQV